MQLSIQSLHFTANRELVDYITEKVNKLPHLYDKIEHAEVCLKLDRSDTTQNKVCEIRLKVPGNDLFAQKQAIRFEDAALEAIDALKQQIRKMKTKFENQSKSQA